MVIYTGFTASDFLPRLPKLLNFHGGSLFRMYGCVGWSVPLLFVSNKKTVFYRRVSLIMHLSCSGYKKCIVIEALLPSIEQHDPIEFGSIPNGFVSNIRNINLLWQS